MLEFVYAEPPRLFSRGFLYSTKATEMFWDEVTVNDPWQA